MIACADGLVEHSRRRELGGAQRNAEPAEPAHEAIAGVALALRMCGACARPSRGCAHRQARLEQLLARAILAARGEGVPGRMHRVHGKVLARGASPRRRPGDAEAAARAMPAASHAGPRALRTAAIATDASDRLSGRWPWHKLPATIALGPVKSRSGS